MATATEAGYKLDGSLLEACSCGVLCPCWIGVDPDNGTCESINAYRFEQGTIRGVDVGGLAVINVCLIPGNVLTPGSWRIAMFIDERANEEQFDAIRAAFTGELGGPLADLAGLIGDVIAVERAPIVHETRDGKGVLKIGDAVSSEMRPFTGPDGS